MTRPYTKTHQIELASEYDVTMVLGKRSSQLSGRSTHVWHVAHEHREIVVFHLVPHIRTPISMNWRDLCSIQLQRQTCWLLNAWINLFVDYIKCVKQFTCDNIPWQTECGTNLNEKCEHKQVQMIATTLFQFVFFAIDNDSRDLLVHENENDTE